jgi:hypothetical protein
LSSQGGFLLRDWYKMVDGENRVCHTDRKFMDFMEHRGIWIVRKIAVFTLAASIVASVGCTSDKTHAETPGLPAKSSASAMALLTDINGHWAKESILAALNGGYVDGYEDGTFRPDQNVSRAEYVKMVVTAMKLDVAKQEAGDNWYTPFVNAAVKAGIHRWSDFTTGDWNTAITRLEMARIAIRATKAELQNPAVHTDDVSVMYNAVKMGLLQGLGRGELGMDRATNRAQSVTIIERILSVLNGGTLPVDKYALGNAELKLKKTNIFTVMPEFFGGKQLDSFTWNPDNLVLETPDGKWKGELDQLVAIDLDDPNDPNLSLLPDIEKLHFFNFNGPEKGPLVKDFPHSYILLYKSRVIYNNDHAVYADWIDHMTLEISGFKSPDFNAFEKGTLNTIASIFVNRDSDMTAYIIPKSALTSGTIYMRVKSPAIAPNPQYEKKILGVGIADKNRWIK